MSDKLSRVRVQFSHDPQIETDHVTIIFRDTPDSLSHVISNDIHFTDRLANIPVPINKLIGTNESNNLGTLRYSTNFLLNFLHELRHSKKFRQCIFRQNYLSFVFIKTNNSTKSLRFIQTTLIAPYESSSIPLDKVWWSKLELLIKIKVRLEESNSWLSTIGGAMSCLGENDPNFCVRAGLLSIRQQLRVAKIIGDPRLIAKCRIFAALALCQLGKKALCYKFMEESVLPAIRELPERDLVIENMYKHVSFRLENNIAMLTRTELQ